MKVKLLAGAVAALALIAGTAQAADLNANSLKDPASPYTGDNAFSGFYIDGGIGGAVTTTTFDKTIAGSLKPSNYSFSGFAADADIGYRFASGYWRYIVYGNIGGQSITLDNAGVNQNLKYGGGFGIGYVLHGALWSLNTGYSGTQIQGSGVNQTINSWTIMPRVDVPLTKNISAFAATEIDYAPDQTIKGVSFHQLEIYPKVGLSISLGSLAGGSLK